MSSPSVRIGIFVAACIAQLAVVGGGIVKHERALASGTPYRFALAPVDPVDPFRGRYVALGYEIERDGVRVPAPAAEDHGKLVYLVLDTDDAGFARVRSIERHRPREGDFVRARLNGWNQERVFVDLPFDRYFAEESEAQRIERDFARRSPTAPKSYAVVRVLDGHGVIESLVVNVD